MNFGFDLEGTLDAEVSAFSAICVALTGAGHQVFVVTAYYCEQMTTRDLDQEHLRQRQLDAIQFREGVHYTTVLFAPGSTAEEQGEKKRLLCEQFNIALMFEDREVFTQAISRTTRCVLMQPRS